MEIEILGKKYGLAFTLVSKDIARKELHKKLDELIVEIQQDDAEALAKFIWICVKTNAVMKGEELTLTYTDIYYNLSLNSKELQNFLNFITPQENSEEKKILSSSETQ